MKNAHYHYQNDFLLAIFVDAIAFGGGK